jgi:hypothetical protein
VLLKVVRENISELKHGLMSTITRLGKSYERMFKDNKKFNWRYWNTYINEFSNQGDIDKFYAELLEDVRLFKQQTVPQLNNEYKEYLKWNF